MQGFTLEGYRFLMLEVVDRSKFIILEQLFNLAKFFLASLD